MVLKTCFGLLWTSITRGLWWWWWWWWQWLFPPHLQGFWENVWPVTLCLHFFSVFLDMEIIMRILFPLFRPWSVHSGSASWDDCGWVFPDELLLSSSPDRSPHYAWTVAESAHSVFIWWRMYACSGVTFHLHFWQNDRGLLSAIAKTQGWNAHWIRVGTQSWLWRRKFFCCSCQDVNSWPFNHESNITVKEVNGAVRSIYCYDVCMKQNQF